MPLLATPRKRYPLLNQLPSLCPGSRRLGFTWAEGGQGGSPATRAMLRQALANGARISGAVLQQRCERAKATCQQAFADSDLVRDHANRAVNQALRKAALPRMEDRARRGGSQRSRAVKREASQLINRSRSHWSVRRLPLTVRRFPSAGRKLDSRHPLFDMRPWSTTGAFLFLSEVQGRHVGSPGRPEHASICPQRLASPSRSPATRWRKSVRPPTTSPAM